MNGLGNDYVFIDARLFNVENPAELSRRVSDRQRGIGSDGLVLIGESDKADVSMRIFNADGSEAQMCGNAARCIGKYLYDISGPKKTSYSLETLSGIKELTIHTDKDGKAVRITVDMGSFEILSAEPIIDGCRIEGTAIRIGNPHFVIFTDKLEEITRLGPILEHHPAFPEGTNVEFAKITDRTHIRMKVWERGSGQTKACGTGACAAVAAACRDGLVDINVSVEMDGGTLQISCDPITKRILMTGPAQIEFEGESDQLRQIQHEPFGFFPAKAGVGD